MLAIISFLHPEFLYGLFVLAVPVILHFFSFKKYKKVYFSNFNFLQSLQQEKKNSSKLKNLLLLLLRMLAITAIVILFASPYIVPKNSPAQASQNKPSVILYVDNSFSMSNTGSKSSLLEESKKSLYDIVSNYPAGTVFTLSTNDNANNSGLTKEQAIELLGGIKTTAASKTLSTVFKETRELSGSEPSTLFILSDFQKNICDFPQITPDTLLEPVFLLLEPENRNNLYISDVVFEQALHKKSQNDKVSVRIVNFSDKDFNNVPVSLTINDKKKSVNKININANSSETVDISYLNTEEGFYKGIVEISDFPVVFDNKFYFSYNIDSKVNVLCIEQDRHNPFFGKLFSDTTDFTITYANVNQTANLNFSRYNLIVLNELNSSWSGLESAVETYVNDGGNLLILPGNRISANVFNKMLQKMHTPQFSTTDTNTTVSRIEEQASVFKNVFEQLEDNTVLPRTKQYYKLTNTAQAEKLLSDKPGNPLFISQNRGKGRIYISAFSFAPDNSDMVYHPLFVPLMVNMAYNVSSGLKTSYFLQNDQNIVINDKELAENEKLLIRSEAGNFEFIPEIRKDFSGNTLLTNTGNIRDAGLYDVIQNDKAVDVLAFNYDRKESELKYSGEEELKKYFPSARIEHIKTTRLDSNSELIKEIVLQDNSKSLSGWFALLAVLLLLAEQFIWRKKLN